MPAIALGSATPSPNARVFMPRAYCSPMSNSLSSSRPTSTVMSRCEWLDVDVPLDDGSVTRDAVDLQFRVRERDADMVLTPRIGRPLDVGGSVEADHVVVGVALDDIVT